LEDLGASIFRAKLEAARSSKTFVSYSNTTWHYNPEYLDLNLPQSENLKSYKKEFLFARYVTIQIFRFVHQMLLVFLTTQACRVGVVQGKFIKYEFKVIPTA
jgi:hypothetical protein